jgi:hypothetical protein
MKSEDVVSSEGMIHGSKLGMKFYRNNNGAMQDKTGRVVFYGLRYPSKGSKKLNDTEKSPDYIVAVPIRITQAMVGHTVCVMGGFEAKKEDCRLDSLLKNEKSHESGQNRWLTRLLQLGGIAGFFRNNSDIDQIIANFFKRFE